MAQTRRSVGVPIANRNCLQPSGLNANVNVITDENAEAIICR
jgi:hypothetical protein